MWRYRELGRTRESIHGVNKKWCRAVLSHSGFSGLKRPHLDRLLVELRGPREAKVEGQRHERRGHRRHRIAGAGRHHELEFANRMLVTLAALRLQIPHAGLALMFEVDRSTITRAVHQVRPLLAGRGFATPEGHTLRRLADVLAYADHHKVARRVDGSEIQVRRPRASRLRRIHDQTAIKSEGIDGLLADYPDVAIKMNNGYRGLGRDYPGQVTCPPKKPRKNTAEAETQTWREARHAQSSSRICVEHGFGELKP